MVIGEDRVLFLLRFVMILGMRRHLSLVVDVVGTTVDITLKLCLLVVVASDEKDLGKMMKGKQGAVPVT